MEHLYQKSPASFILGGGESLQARLLVQSVHKQASLDGNKSRTFSTHRGHFEKRAMLCGPGTIETGGFIEHLAQRAGDTGYGSLPVFNNTER